VKSGKSRRLGRENRMAWTGERKKNPLNKNQGRKKSESGRRFVARSGMNGGFPRRTRVSRDDNRRRMAE
jgi:hypothetical protein